jgi:hypothetical protein
MEKQIIKCRIDVSKIDKAKIYTGEKDKWYDFTLIESHSNYSDWMITEDLTADERKAGRKGTILGNGKNLERRESDNAEIPF